MRSSEAGATEAGLACKTKCDRTTWWHCHFERKLEGVD